MPGTHRDQSGDNKWTFLPIIFSLSLCLSLPAEFYTTQPVLEQVFSQSASLQRWPWKSKYFPNNVMPENSVWITVRHTMKIQIRPQRLLLTCLAAHTDTFTCSDVLSHTHTLTHIKHVWTWKQFVAPSECLMPLSVFSAALPILILPSNNVVQRVMNNKYM